MDERSLIDLANKIRLKNDLVAYTDLNDNTVKVLNSEGEFVSIPSEEDLGSSESYYTWRSGLDVLNTKLQDFCEETLSGGSLEMPEIAMLMFCDKVAFTLRIGGLAVTEGKYYFNEEYYKTQNEVQLAIIKLVNEQTEIEDLSEKDLSKYKLANELRQKYGMVAYVTGNSGNEVVVAKVKDKEKDIAILDSLPTQEDLSRFLLNQKGSLSSLEDFDTILPILESCFEEEEITEYTLLILCDNIANYLHLGHIYLLGEDTIYVLGKAYTNTRELTEALPSIIREELEKQIQGALTNLTKMASDYEYTQDGRAVILDGITYIADSFKTLSLKKGFHYIEGYLQNGNVVWSKVDPSKFKEVETEVENGSAVTIGILETLYYSELYVVYRAVSKKEKNNVTKSPYPVAILEDGEYAFYFETKTDEEVEELEKKNKPKWYSSLMSKEKKFD